MPGKVTAEVTLKRNKSTPYGVRITVAGIPCNFVEHPMQVLARGAPPTCAFRARVGNIDAPCLRAGSTPTRPPDLRRAGRHRADEISPRIQWRARSVGWLGGSCRGVMHSRHYLAGRRHSSPSSSASSSRSPAPAASGARLLAASSSRRVDRTAAALHHHRRHHHRRRSRIASSSGRSWC